MMPISLPSLRTISGLGTRVRACLELARQAVHVVGVVVGTLAVLRTSRCGRCRARTRPRRMIGAGQGAVADAVAVHIFVAREAAQPFEIFGGQNLAAVLRLLGILERLRHPVVHAQIEVGHDEHRRLQLLRQIKRIARHAETFADAGLGISMGWRVSPCDKRGHESRCRPARCASASPVEGPTRCMSQMTPGIST